MLQFYFLLKSQLNGYGFWTTEDKWLESPSPLPKPKNNELRGPKEEDKGKETVVVITTRTLCPIDSLQYAPCLLFPFRTLQAALTS